MNEEFRPIDPFVFYKVQNGFVLMEQDKNEGLLKNRQFVFRNTDELCEWIKNYYKEFPQYIGAV